MPNPDKHNKNRSLYILCIAILAVLAGCSDTALNNPYPERSREANVFYTNFEERPKHLDPVQSYVSNEYEIIANIYEPPVQYHYLKRPYQLIPLAASKVPRPQFLDNDFMPLPDDAADVQVAYSRYEISIKPGIRYQPHPAFARDEQGRFLYHDLSDAALDDIRTLADLGQTDSRELVAADYVYQLKRLAHPALHSPIYGIMSDYIIGLKEYGAELKKHWDDIKQNTPEGEMQHLDLTKFDLAGVELVDKYTYRITIRGQYPQFAYWLAMPFFSPIPPEADRFYAQPGLIERNITLDWYPVGTGPYMLTENNPNLRMMMERNPNFHGETYPTDGEAGDRERGLLDDAEKPLPFIDKVVFSLEKESIPAWNKFLQGYYDASGISSDSFDQAIKLGAEGEAGLTDEMQAKGIKLVTAVTTSMYYMAFNWLDPVVGGDSKRARKLRQAISIAIDMEEFISIFLNGRGVALHGPLPPGIFGYRDGKLGMNQYVFNWDKKKNRPRRKSIEQARKLLTEAGYPNGIDPANGKPLLINYDTANAGPGEKAYLDWLRKQFNKLNIKLVIRNTDFNRFQEKVLKGNAQFFRWGWNADYPDPENFLFLLYGPNKKVGLNGENAANYSNPEFDRLFEQMKTMPNGTERQRIIDEMLEILQHDAPWVFMLAPKAFSLYHDWYRNVKPNLMANNTLKYKRIDPELRARLRTEWNQPIYWPVIVTLLLVLLALIPGVISYINKEHRAEAGP
jgi:ABC-type transport system substrate-binding protein